MNRMEVISLVFFIFFFFDVCAQNGPDDNNGRLRPIQPGIAVVIGILSVTLSLTFLVLSCAKFCGTNGRDGLGDEDGQRGLLRSRSRFSGIDTKVIESLPFFRFSSLKGSKKGLECVVCLSKFEDSETLRLLPKCRHAFHMDCIDKWLENHSSCPLCRYKFDVADLTNFSHTNSLRYPQTAPNLADNLNLELFVKREGDRSSRSSRFNLGSSFQKFGKGKKEEALIQYDNRKLLDKFKHRIIVSDIVCKSRWSDVNSSDLMFLNSEMLNVMSSNRFSPLNSASNSGKFHSGLSMDEEIMKVKEDMERKRLYDSKVSKITRSYSSASASSLPSTSNSKTDPNKSTTMLRSLDPAVKRSMSEITNISRFTEFSTRNGIKESLFWGNNGNDDKIRNVWLPIARKTVQWFAGRERNSLRSESKREPSSV